MVEVGSMEIGGSMQTADIERGMTRVKKGFEEISVAGKSVEGDFERIAASGRSAVTVFGGMALAGGGAIIALAKGAPALAGSMAKIQVSMLKLKMASGEALAPMFEEFNDILQDVTNFASSNPDLFGKITESILKLGGVALAIGIGGKVYKSFKALFLLLASPAALSAMGVLGGVVGAAAVGGAGLGYVNKLAADAQAQKEYSQTSGIPESEFTKAYFEGYQGTVYNTNPQPNPEFYVDINKWSRNQTELDMSYYI